MKCDAVQSNMYFGVRSPQQLAKKANKRKFIEMEEQSERIRQNVEHRLHKMKKAEQKFKNNHYDGWDENERLHDLMCYG